MNPRLSREEFLSVFGPEDQLVGNWNSWRNGRTREELGILAGCDFRDLALPGIDFTHATLTGCRFGGTGNKGPANLRGTVFIAADGRGATFEKADLSNAQFQEARLGASSDIDDEYLRRLSIGIIATTPSLHSGTSFRSCNLTQAKFTNSVLGGVAFRRCVLDGASFNAAELVSTTFEFVIVNSRTSFEGVHAYKMAMDKLTLESLGPSHGGLTAGQLADMTIDDGVAALRNSFSGFWQWIHALALTAFMAPYVLFLVKHSVRAHFMRDEAGGTVSLLEALGQYIASGGTASLGVWAWSWTALLFAFGMIYNVLRAVLLVKTKQLELHQEISGVPARFSLRGSAWGKLARAAAFLFWVNLVVVLLHTVHFLQQRVPVNPVAMPPIGIPTMLSPDTGDGR